MLDLRTHYLTIDGARCGIVSIRNWTVDPKKVTCATCKRLMAGEMK